MCLSLDVGENFLSRFRPSDASSVGFSSSAGCEEKELLQFSPPLLSPTLPNFAHFAHLRPDKLSKPVPHREDGGDSKSKTLLFNSTRARPPFITFTTRRTAVAVECLRFYLGGWMCCCLRRHFCPGCAVAVQEGIHRRSRKIKERAKWPFGLDGWLAFDQLLLPFGFCH